MSNRVRERNRASSANTVFGGETRNLDSDEPRRRFKDNPKFEYLLAKVNALFWVALAVVVFFYCEIHAIIQDGLKQGDRTMTLGLLTLLVSTIIALYCTVWLRMILRITGPWETSAPYMIEAATFSGFISYLSFTFAFWKHYGILSLLIVPCLFLGYIMTSQFVPIS